jgi:hypothetical protein
MRLAAAVLAGVVVLTAVGYGASVLLGKDVDHVQVQALWYGKTADGTVVGGVTPVEITAITDDAAPVLLDLTGEKQAGAGPMWTAATATAGVQAVLESGADPRTGQLKYSLSEAIDGPSAGALLTVGSLAAIRSISVSDSITMTGTVLPDGSVGPVAGVPEKIRAAADAGIEQVLIPTTQQSAIDISTGLESSMGELGASLGVEVTPVASIAEAFAIMTGTQPPKVIDEAESDLDPQLVDLLVSRARELNAATTASVAVLSGGEPLEDPTAKADAARVSGLKDASVAALERGDAVLGFAAAAEGSLAARQWQAAAELQATSKATPLSRLIEVVGEDAAREEARVRDAVRATAERPVVMVEQLPALADALAWGTFAVVSMDIGKANLARVESLADLYAVVRFIEVGTFESEVYMPICDEAVDFVGNVPMADVAATVGLFDAYSDLLNYASDSNVAYAQAVGEGAGDTSYLGQVIEEVDALAESVATEFPGLSSPTAESALTMSAALVDFVSTTQLVNGLTRDAGGDLTSPNLAPIKDPQTVSIQAEVADQIASTQIRSIAESGFDPSYVEWNKEWGADLAFGGLPGTTDEQTLHGVEFQWFAVLQSRLLTALAQGEGRA